MPRIEIPPLETLIAIDFADEWMETTVRLMRHAREYLEDYSADSTAIHFICFSQHVRSAAERIESYSDYYNHGRIHYQSELRDGLNILKSYLTLLEAKRKTE